MNKVPIFEYPATPHVRRHGPFGYRDYESYRQWLRDEFCFRCVFCLRREQWNRLCATFHLDHRVAQRAAPGKTLDYDNLLYVCASCNSLKGDLDVPDPCKFAYGDCVQVLADGRIQPLNENGELLIDLLHLDRTDAVRYRRFVIDTVRALRDSYYQETYLDWIRFPDDLPELSRKNPPGNMRPNGVNESWFAKRARNELPTAY